MNKNMGSADRVILGMLVGLAIGVLIIGGQVTGTLAVILESSRSCFLQPAPWGSVRCTPR